MTLNEAKENAKNNMEAKNSTIEDPYKISVEMAESVRELVGKKLKFAHGIVEIITWIGQNYVIKINDDYAVTPAMFMLTKKYEII